MQQVHLEAFSSHPAFAGAAVLRRAWHVAAPPPHCGRIFAPQVSGPLQLLAIKANNPNTATATHTGGVVAVGSWAGTDLGAMVRTGPLPASPTVAAGARGFVGSRRGCGLCPTCLHEVDCEPWVQKPRRSHHSTTSPACCRRPSFCPCHFIFMALILGVPHRAVIAPLLA